jgi:isoquinoline 1-oxidoreductase
MTTIQKSNKYDEPNESSELLQSEYQEPLERVPYDFGITRRGFVQVLGAGLLITVSAGTVLGQRRGGPGGGRPVNVSARIHIAKDGKITVLTGKVEEGQGARTELTQAAAEELRVPVSQVQLTTADTSITPDDGTTAGSGTTPRTVPTVRQGAAAARQALVQIAAERWGVDSSTLEVRDGKITQADTGRTLSYGDLAGSDDLTKAFGQAPPSDITLTPVKEWKIMGVPVPRPNARDIVTGAHKYPSDITLPGMYHGKILRPPSYGAKLVSIDLAPAKAMKDVVAVEDG